MIPAFCGRCGYSRAVNDDAKIIYEQFINPILHMCLKVNELKTKYMVVSEKKTTDQTKCYYQRHNYVQGSYNNKDEFDFATRLLEGYRAFQSMQNLLATET